MTQVVPMTLGVLKTHFIEGMQTSLDPTNPIRADVVKIGLLQEAKVRSNIQIGITGGDHEQPDDIDGILTMEGLPDIGIKLPSREVGGGQAWMRRGVVRVECFFIREKLDEEAAHIVAYDVLGRCMELVETAPVNGLEDDFGERVLTIHCYANTYFESGGPPDKFIFRGKIFWAIHTERP